MKVGAQIVVPIAGVPSQEKAHAAADQAVARILKALREDDRLGLEFPGMEEQIESLRNAVREMFWIDWSEF